MAEAITTMQGQMQGHMSQMQGQMLEALTQQSATAAAERSEWLHLAATGRPAQHRRGLSNDHDRAARSGLPAPNIFAVGSSAQILPSPPQASRPHGSRGTSQRPPSTM